jgi:hypothetical protein
MKRAAFFFIVFFFFGFPCFAGMGDLDGFAKGYLNEIRNRNGAVFVSRCESDGDTRYTATLLFEVGKTQGLLKEEENGVVVNLATVDVAPHGLRIEETHGGIYTYGRVMKLVNELRERDFRLFAPLRLDALEEMKALGACMNAP